MTSRSMRMASFSASIVIWNGIGAIPGIGRPVLSMGCVVATKAINAPEAVSRTVTLLRAATTQEEQVTNVTALRNIKTGWTENLRRDYLAWLNGARSKQHPLQVMKWFTDAGANFNNGSSSDDFMEQARKDTMDSMTPAEIADLGDLTTPPRPAGSVRKATKPSS